MDAEGRLAWRYRPGVEWEACGEEQERTSLYAVA
jgi:hypothetical protein